MRRDLPDLEVGVDGEKTETAATLYPEMGFRRSLYRQLDDWSRCRRRKLAALALLLVAWASRLGNGPRLLPLLSPDLQASMEEYRSADMEVSSGGASPLPHHRRLPQLLDLLDVLAPEPPLGR